MGVRQGARVNRSWGGAIPESGKSREELVAVRDRVALRPDVSQLQADGAGYHPAPNAGKLAQEDAFPSRSCLTPRPEIRVGCGRRQSGYLRT